MLDTGIKAPDFTLPDQNGEMRSLSDYAAFLNCGLSLRKRAR